MRLYLYLWCYKVRSIVLFPSRIAVGLWDCLLGLVYSGIFNACIHTPHEFADDDVQFFEGGICI